MSQKITKRRFLIATHGRFAGGIKSSLDIIIGETENVVVLEAYVDNAVQVDQQLDLIVKQLGPNEELIVFTDLLGGSITNQAIQFALKENVHVVSGFNLALLIDVVLADVETPFREVIDAAIENAKNQIVYVNQLIQSKQEENNDD